MCVCVCYLHRAERTVEIQLLSANHKPPSLLFLQSKNKKNSQLIDTVVIFVDLWQQIRAINKQKGA